MKIALVIERMDTSRGGREMSTAQVACALAHRGHEVTILCQSGEPLSHDAVTVAPLGCRGTLQSSRWMNFVSDVRKAVSDGRFDIVHAMLPLPFADVYQPRGGTVPAQVEASCRRRRGLMRYAARAIEPLNFRRRFMARLERQVAADPGVLCLAVSDMVLCEFAQYYGRMQNVQVIYNAVNVPVVTQADRDRWRQELRRKIGAGPGDMLFVTIATNYALKGVAELVNAFADWRESDDRGANARLAVIGQGEVAKYKRLADKRKVGQCVAFLPPAKDVFPWYFAADACILLSWYDPCSRVVLEAYRSGLPCLTTRFNGAGEILENTGAGIVVSSPAYRDGIVSALADLADPAKRARRVEACARLADRLSIDRHVSELLAAYEKVIVRRGTK